VRGAPATVARLRNKLTHPKDAGEPYSIEGVLAESWFLVTEWAESCFFAESAIGENTSHERTQASG
jgi:hypothetical protein